MPIALVAPAGLFAALLINRAADCWLNPAPLACGLTRRPRRQWLVIITLPVLFVGLAQRHEGLALVAAGLLSAVLLLLAVVDWEQRRLPNVVVLPALVAAVALSVAPMAAALTAALAFVVFAGFYALGRRLYGPGALGAGDVKLAALVGATVGWPAAGFALALGVLLAGGAAAVLLATRRAAPGATLPYGFFLAVGAVAVMLFVGG